MSAPAWIHPVAPRKCVVVSESNVFPGHAQTHPNSFSDAKAAARYAHANGLRIVEGRCPLPRMPQGRPTRDDAPAVTKQHIRTLMGEQS